MFDKGKSYDLIGLYEKYGGQRQRGICTPKNFPFIMLFTGSQGDEFGYFDKWTDEGVFQYTGEGQKGDMVFTHGNKALRDHLKNGKDIHVFKILGSGIVRYINNMVFIGFNYMQRPDITGKFRNTIQFHLLPIQDFNHEHHIQISIEEGNTLADLREWALGQEDHPKTSRESVIESNYRSNAVKQYALIRADGHCEACGKPAPFKTIEGQPFLEVHHIRRLSDGGPDHPSWVAAVCPNCHRRAHFSNDYNDFNNQIRNKILEKEQVLSHQ